MNVSRVLSSFLFANRTNLVFLLSTAASITYSLELFQPTASKNGNRTRLTTEYMLTIQTWQETNDITSCLVDKYCLPPPCRGANPRIFSAYNKPYAYFVPVQVALARGPVSQVIIIYPPCF